MSAVSEASDDAIRQARPLGSTLDPLTKFGQVPGSGSGVKEHLPVPFEQVGEAVSQQLRNRRPDPGPRIECIHPDDFHLQVGRSLKHRVQGILAVGEPGEKRAEHDRRLQSEAARFLQHPETILYACRSRLPMDPEVLVERGHRDTDPCLLANKQFEVAKDEVALGQHMHLEPVLQQQLAAAAGQPPIPFDRLPAITGTAYEDLTRLRMAELPPERLDRVHFDVDELAPGFRMGMESLHEPGVTIDAGVFAAGIAVQGVVAQGGPIQNRLTGRFPDDDLRQICACRSLRLERHLPCSLRQTKVAIVSAEVLPIVNCHSVGREFFDSRLVWESHAIEVVPDLRTLVLPLLHSVAISQYYLQLR